MTTGISGTCLKARGVRSSGLFFTTIKPNQNMKNILIGFLSATVLLLTIGQASKDDKYEVTTKWSSHSSYSWGDNVSLWKEPWKWSADEKAETNLQEMYENGWRLVSYQKTNASAETYQYSWVFERKK